MQELNLRTFELLFDVLHKINAPLFSYLPVTNGLIESHPMNGLNVTASENDGATEWLPNLSLEATGQLKRLRVWVAQGQDRLIKPICAFYQP